MKKLISFLLVCVLLFSIIPMQTFADSQITSVQEQIKYESKYDIQSYVQKVSDFVLKDKKDLSEWEVVGLARTDKKVPESYYKQLEKSIKEKKGNFRKITDYERIVLALTAIGKDPRNIAGYDLIEKICNSERMTYQGTNGVIYGLIALDSNNYQEPKNLKWNREKLVKWILNQQNQDGGFPLYEGRNSDIDMTAMALQALSNYKDKKDVKETIDKAINFLSKNQLKDGGFKSWGTNNSESVSQTIIALTSLGINPEKDSRFIKNGNNMIGKLITFISNNGGFSHAKSDSYGSNGMATEQGLMALVAYNRFLNDENKLYDMTK